MFCLCGGVCDLVAKSVSQEVANTIETAEHLLGASKNFFGEGVDTCT